MVSEVAMSVDHLGKNVENFHLVKTRNNRSELARLRAELDESIDVAKRVEERTESLGKSVKYDASEFE